MNNLIITSNPLPGQDIIGTLPCHKCNSIVSYTTRFAFEVMSEKPNKVMCRDCVKKFERKSCNRRRKIELEKLQSLTRNCPRCGKVLHYQDRTKLARAIADNSKCNSCGNRRYLTEKERREAELASRRRHYNKWKEKYKKTSTEKL